MSALKDAEEGLMNYQELIKPYLVEYEDKPTLTVSRIIYECHKDAFHSLEHVRGVVRYARANHGNKNRSTLKDKSLARPNGTQSDFSLNLPDPIVEITKWETIKINESKTLILSDVHLPYFDKFALELALQKGRDEGCTAILLNGDVLDIYSESKYVKNPALRDMAKERDIACLVLDEIREMFPDAKIWLKLGNHEERLELAIWSKNPHYVNLKEMSIEGMFRLKDMDITCIKDRKPVRIGALYIVHGHEFPGGIFAPVNPARTYFLKAKVCVLGAHLHRTSEHAENTLSDKIISAWSTGCLCNLHPKYSPINQWNHGFAIIEKLKGENFKVNNYKIIEGVVY